MRYLVVIAVGLLPASPAWADIASDKRGCVRDSGLARINACSRLIQSGRFSAAHQAVACNNRSLAYRRLRRYRRAIQDYNEAQLINPRYANHYANRGLAYEQLGEKQLAIRDYRKILSFPPGHRFGLAGLMRLRVKP